MAEALSFKIIYETGYPKTFPELGISPETFETWTSFRDADKEPLPNILKRQKDKALRPKRKRN